MFFRFITSHFHIDQKKENSNVVIFSIAFSNDKKKIMKFNSTMRREKKIYERKKNV